MESVGRLAGGVAHDFNNKLTTILGHANIILEQIDSDQPFHDDLMEIRKAGERAADLTRQLLAFARKQTVTPKVIDLIAGVGKMAIETGNTVFDGAYGKDHAGYVLGEYVMIAVNDDGCGMDSKTLLLLFEPFFTTKEKGKGTGLGLATVYGIVKQNNGFINVYSEPGQGATFHIYLPRHAATKALLPGKAPVQTVSCGHETILLVEDEPAILKMTTIMLNRQGYTVLAASCPTEAIRLASEHAGRIDLLITDVIMPKMNGWDLAKSLLSSRPSLKRLFISGYTADIIAHQGMLDEGEHFIQKPFLLKDLRAKVREAMGE